MARPALQVLLAITLVVAANYYWSPRTSQTVDEETRERQRALPKTYIEQTRAWSFDETGALTDILEAEKIEQFGRGNVSMLTMPKFYAHSRDDKTWSAVAERGRFEAHSERLLLRREVVLTHDQTGTSMATQALDIELDDKTAISDKRVTITQGENRTTADGMIARLQEETITLKPNVESTYVQQP